MKSEGGAKREEKDPKAEKEKGTKNKLPDSQYGLNRFAWNLRYPEAKKFEGLILWGGGTDRSARAARRRTRAADRRRRSTARPPRTGARTRAPRHAQADLQAQFDFLLAANREADRDPRADRAHPRSAQTARRPEEADRQGREGEADRRRRESPRQEDDRGRRDAVPDEEPQRRRTRSTSRSASTTSWPPSPTPRPPATSPRPRNIARSTRSSCKRSTRSWPRLARLWTTDLPALNVMVKASEVVPIH